LGPLVHEWDDLLGPDDPESVDAFGGLGVLFELNFDHVRAESVYREYVERSARVRGRRHPTTALGMQGHADALSAMGEGDQALAIIREALEIRSSTTGKKDHHYFGLLKGLANQELRRGRLEQAEEAYAKVAEFYKPQGSLEYAVALTDLAFVVHARGNCDRAQALQKQALELAERSGNEKATGLASVLFRQAEFDFMHQRFDSAVRYQIWPPRKPSCARR
jgi:tetratricopeptide (TPR) repeat protein